MHYMHTMIRSARQSPMILKMCSILEFTFNQMDTLITKMGELSTMKKSPSYYLNPWLSKVAGIGWYKLHRP